MAVYAGVRYSPLLRYEGGVPKRGLGRGVMILSIRTEQAEKSSLDPSSVGGITQKNEHGL